MRTGATTFADWDLSLFTFAGASVTSICHDLDIYLRTTSQTRKDGTVVRYLQLAHNAWDGEKSRSATKVLCNFGREDAEKREGLERLLTAARGLDQASQAGF